MSTSQEYKSSSHTAIESSESTLLKPQLSVPRKSQELTWSPKVVQAVTENLIQNATEVTPAYGQRDSKKATQVPKPKKTEDPKDPSQSTSTTEAPEGPRPSKSRSTLSVKERIRRAKAVRAQGWKLKAQRSSQKVTKTPSLTHSTTHSDIGESANDTPGQTPWPSKAADSLSFSEISSTDLSSSESFLELTNLLTQEVQQIPGDREKLTSDD
jgi:hypothetical protein